ncbi:hypothetical protein M427DRAFT_66061 [Gonapodya prolifera JEL478]|uniref:Stress-associated endoplasmic reticulum protein n=1 Tax=Gonapodya prolifera (strain JEL478) TaxID=1344416 RepID=A0A139AX84_GONPJ|nr:hypothetical protein M427DRAFT_66061 [Gonapodya prolifera JEL478]|eukprot:KXS21330.1 hypothetical protein M427DRAFT_66061 [Gonapodya prolifera JEL478]
MAGTPTIRARNTQHQSLAKKGKAPSATLKKNESKIPVGPWTLALFLFIVVGGVLFEMVSRLYKGF